MSWLLDGRPVRRVLLTRLRYLGDIAMTTILIEVLRRGDPDLTIGYLCEADHGAILADHPELDRLHLLAIRRRGADARARVSQGQADGPVPPAGTWRMVRELRRAGYDLAIDLFFNPRSAWLLWLAGIPGRIGGTRGGRRHLYSHIVRREDVQAESLDRLAPGGLGEHLCRLAPLRHAESGLDFLTWAEAQDFGPGLKPRLATAPDRRAGAPRLVLAPAATWPSKEWPTGHWRALIRDLIAAGGPHLEILVPPGRGAEWGDLAHGLPEAGVSTLPPGGLDRVRSVLTGARGLISADGGVMHLGVALGVPTLGLFGPTDPDIWFPYAHLGPYRVLAMRPHCHPCDRRDCGDFICLPELAPGTVVQAARDLFRFEPGVPS